MLRLEHYRGGELIGVREGELAGGFFPNLIVDAAKAVISAILTGTGQVPNKIGIGTGTTAPVAGDTALETSIDNQTCTASVTTITLTDDTAQYIYTFSFAAPHDITEAGLFSATTLFARQTFAAVSVLATDTLKVTWKIQA